MISGRLGNRSQLLYRLLIATAISGCAVLALKSSTRWMQGLAVASGLSAIGAAAMSGRGQMRAPQQTEETSANLRSTIVEPLTYTSAWTRPGWTQLGENDETQVFPGRAAAYFLKDRVVIRQEEDAGGAYMIDLKRRGNGLSGLWWFYGGLPPHGVFRGSISKDYSIDATWLAPDGTHGGSWTLTPADSTAQDSKFTVRQEE